MAYKEPRTKVCERCSKPYETTSPQARRCPECRSLHWNEVRRRKDAHVERECDQCGTPYTTYKSDQRFCSACSDQRYSNRGTASNLQMERLFRYYKAKDSITFDGAKSGNRLVSLSDAQIPFLDEALWQAVLTFVDDFKPHDIVINGDWMDAYDLSDFDKRPGRQFDIMDEIEMAQETLAQLQRRAAGRARIWWVDGNHEERFTRNIWKHAQGFSDLVKDLHEALELEKLTQGFVPWGKHVNFHGFAFTHGHIVRKNAAYTARAMLDSYGSSGASGHTHRAGSHSKTDMHGRTHTWYEQGCLCRVDLEYIKGVADWQQAFLVGTMHGDSLHPSLVRVIEQEGKRGFSVYGQHYSI